MMASKSKSASTPFSTPLLNFGSFESRTTTTTTTTTTPSTLRNTMRFFRRNKKKQPTDGAPVAPASPIVISGSDPTLLQVHTNTNTNMHKEPLLSPQEQEEIESVPSTKISVTTGNATASNAYTSVNNSAHNDTDNATDIETARSRSASASSPVTTPTPSVSLSNTPSSLSEAASEPATSSGVLSRCYAKLFPAVDANSNVNVNGQTGGDVDISKPLAQQQQPRQPWYNTKTGMAFALCFMLGLTATVSAALLMEKKNSTNKTKNVAFIGNSNFFVNDLPRLMEAMAEGKIFQDSCLHSRGSIMNIIKTGNGMYERWQTTSAAMNVTWVEDADEETTTTAQLYDFGACSVPQLLIGQDSYLAIGGYEDQDDTNPCLQSEDYLAYTESFNYSAPWDFVVLTDQSKRMCFQEAREEALMALNYTYIPILEHTSGIPIVVQPHGFWSESVNMTGLGDVPTFTAKIYKGALEYKEFMELRLPEARIAPVGMAFLTVYQQDKDLWLKLFLDDGIHPSPSGTFLYGCVIYATIYGSMPRTSAVILEDMSSLWSTARKLQSNEFPEPEEAEYLMQIARKVTLQGFLPSNLPNVTEYSEEDQDYDFDEEEDEDAWTADYDGWYDYSNQVSWDNAQYSSNYQNGDYNANANGEYAN